MKLLNVKKNRKSLRKLKKKLKFPDKIKLKITSFWILGESKKFRNQGTRAESLQKERRRKEEYEEETSFNKIR